MKNIRRLLLLLAVCAVPFLAFSAENDKNDYFPVITGSNWEYKTYTANKKIEFVMQVSVGRPEKINGDEYIIMIQKDKRGSMKSFLLKNETGVYVYKTGLRKNTMGIKTPEIYAAHNPPIPMFVYPDSKMKSFIWEGTMKIAFVNKKIQMKGEILGIEKIKVPAGEFECLKMHFYQTRDNEVVEEHAWYAKGIGQVKYQGGKYIKELIKYSRDRKTKK